MNADGKRKHRNIQKLEHAESQNVALSACLCHQGTRALTNSQGCLQRLPGLLTDRTRTEQDFHYQIQNLGNWDPASPLSWGPPAGLHGYNAEPVDSGTQG